MILGNDLCSQFPFIHAITGGCDTTSKIFGVGKKSDFKMLINGDSIYNSTQMDMYYQIRQEMSLETLAAKQWLSQVYQCSRVFALQHVRQESICCLIICETRTSPSYCILHQISLPPTLLPYYDLGW